MCERERLRVCAILAGNTQRAVLHIHAVLSLSLSLSLSHTHTHTLKFSLVIQTKLYSIFMNLSLSHTHTHSLSLSLSRPRARALSLSCLITGEICSYALLHASLRPLQLGADAYGWNRKPQAQVQVPYIYLCVCVCKQEEDTHRQVGSALRVRRLAGDFTEDFFRGEHAIRSADSTCL